MLQLIGPPLAIYQCFASADLVCHAHVVCFFVLRRLDDTIRAARHIGIRFHPVRGAMSRGVSKGGIPPDELVEQEPDILADMRRCIAEYHDNSRCHCCLELCLLAASHLF